MQTRFLLIFFLLLSKVWAFDCSINGTLNRYGGATLIGKGEMRCSNHREQHFFDFHLAVVGFEDSEETAGENSFVIETRDSFPLSYILDLMMDVPEEVRPHLPIKTIFESFLGAYKVEDGFTLSLGEGKVPLVLSSPARIPYQSHSAMFLVINEN